MDDNNSKKKKVIITVNHVVIVACTLGVIAAVVMLISGFISGEFDTDFYMYLGILVACGVPLFITVQDIKKKQDANKTDDE